MTATYRPVRLEAFESGQIEIGDRIAYPALLRPDHKCVRSELLVVGIDGQKLLVVRVDDEGRPGTDEFIVAPSQLQENGVVVYAAE